MSHLLLGTHVTITKAAEVWKIGRTGEVVGHQDSGTWRYLVKLDHNVARVEALDVKIIYPIGPEDTCC